VVSTLAAITLTTARQLQLGTHGPWTRPINDRVRPFEAIERMPHVLSKYWSLFA